ncbi:MAG: hypothetical protein KatS3mg002_0976 [Candidatus Woesearchaeota archaeon]|nr:MAG: hypothetical protein KatS3mg002_0976 [Candidatus Woesearchaeota archaeon]
MIKLLVSIVKFLFRIRTIEDTYKDSIRDSKIIAKYRK